jgi:deoxyribonuclease V
MEIGWVPRAAMPASTPCGLSCDVTRLAPIAVLDVSYASDVAGVACLLANTWTAATPAREISRCRRCATADYISGEFYKRELPLLRAVIDDLTPRPAVLVIDGYVWLGATRAPGLGAHLFAALQSATPIVGVAKSRYRDDTWSERVYRGDSRRPLYVTAAGVETAKAAALLSQMHGKHRIPTLLQRADRLARAALANGCG